MRERLQDAIIHLMYDTSDSVSLKDALHMVPNNYYQVRDQWEFLPDEDDIIECIESLRPYILFIHPYRTLNGTLMDGKLYPTPMFKAKIREWWHVRFKGEDSLAHGAESLNRVLTDLHGDPSDIERLEVVGA